MIQKSKRKFGEFIAFRHMAAACLLALCLVCWAQLPVAACGYRDSTNTRAGILNWVYPNSLHVRGAIWNAQEAGELPYPEADRVTAGGSDDNSPDIVAFQETERVLRALCAGLSEMTPDERKERFSLVLVETVLWSQFTLSGTQNKVDVDTDGPIVGDLVVVTDEPVLYAMVEGSLALSTAVKSGLVKLYGQPEQVNHFLELYGTIGGKALPASNSCCLTSRGG